MSPLAERLTMAAKELDRMEGAMVVASPGQIRLRGKAEGVRLALSYLLEEENAATARAGAAMERVRAPWATTMVDL